MEACDLLGGLRLADEMGIHAVAVEFDSLKVVQDMWDPLEYQASRAMITDDRKLITSFGKTMTVHCAQKVMLLRIGWYEQLQEKLSKEEELRDHPPDFLILSLVTDKTIVY